MDWAKLTNEFTGINEALRQSGLFITVPMLEEAKCRVAAKGRMAGQIMPILQDRVPTAEELMRTYHI